MHSSARSPECDVWPPACRACVRRDGMSVIRHVAPSIASCGVGRSVNQ